MNPIDNLKALSRGTVVATLFATWVLYLVALAFYRLYLSPIAKFPGPKLAAVSKWYEFYYEVVQKGQFSAHIRELHKIYGPIVRITPYELHVDDPPFWETLYNKNPKSFRYDWMNGRFANETSLFTTCDPVHHQVRRKALNPYFSRRAIAQCEPIIQQKLDYTCNKIAGYKDRDQILNFNNVWDAFSGDVITEYAFGFSYDSLKSDDFKDTFHDAFLAIGEFSGVSLQFPWIAVLLNSLPHAMVEVMNPPLEKLLRLQRDLSKSLSVIKADIASGKTPPRSTMFHEIIQSDLPESEKYLRRLQDEAQTVVGAGLTTTSWSLTNAMFYIIDSPRVLEKLRKELFDAIPDIHAPDAFSHAKLENLPYLKGCVREGIRLSHGVCARNPRIWRTPLEFQNWVIPPNVPVGMTIYDVHFNEEIYPKPKEFVPERWLGNPKAPDGSSMERYWVPFGKGPRQCVGINLAYMENFMAIAHIFRKFQFKLYETDVSDVEMMYDFFLPCPKRDSKGVRVKVIEVEK